MQRTPHLSSSVLAAVLACAALTSPALAQPAPAAPPDKITIGLYAPTVEFGAAQARLAYIQGLAKAIEQNTGIKTEAQSYANVGALKKDAVDFAIVDGVCYATNLGWKLLATASIGGGTTRSWALFSAAGDTMQALKGKKLAFIATGCNDAGFVDNAMLESEVDPAFFGARSGKPDLTAAIAEVASYKAAQAVFAPTSSVKGLTKVFDTGAVPNPAFVAISGKLPAATVDKVAAAVIGYGGSGAITSWTKPSREIYASLAGRLGKVAKLGLLANPEPVRIDAKDALIEPTTLKDTALVEVRHHFVRPPGGRMD
jgi:ABC-type phosphate/phosphonate transport system substrate-binding protein